MKRARWLVDSRIYSGHYEEGDNRLVDEAGRAFEPEAVNWLVPCTPSKVIGVALNYADHGAELKFDKPPEIPAIFFKAQNSLVGHRHPVVYPTGSEYMHYEGELGVVIGQRCRRVHAANALEMVAGYTVCNDFTVRDHVINTFRPPIKAKGFDTFGPIGPWVVEGEIESPSGLTVRTYVNGELRQEGNTRDLVFSVPALIEYLTEFMTLEPGDIISTGTPKGISPIQPGDLITVEIPGVGVLENPIVAEVGA